MRMYFELWWLGVGVFFVYRKFDIEFGEVGVLVCDWIEFYLNIYFLVGGQ